VRRGSRASRVGRPCKRRSSTCRERGGLRRWQRAGARGDFCRMWLSRPERIVQPRARWQLASTPLHGSSRAKVTERVWRPGNEWTSASLEPESRASPSRTSWCAPVEACSSWTTDRLGAVRHAARRRISRTPSMIASSAHAWIYESVAEADVHNPSGRIGPNPQSIRDTTRASRLVTIWRDGIQRGAGEYDVDRGSN
jgi:hypothetical protein